MKLTTKRLKKLIKEEMKKLNEALPASFVDRGFIDYKNHKLRYYIFVKGSYNIEDIEGLSQSPVFGHYRVNDKKAGTSKTGALYLKIDQIVQNNPDLNDDYEFVVGITKQEAYDDLLNSGDILEDIQKR